MNVWPRQIFMVFWAKNRNNGNFFFTFLDSWGRVESKNFFFGSSPIVKWFPRGVTRGGYAPALKRIAQEKKLIKLWMPKFGFIIMYHPSFIQKKIHPPPRLRGGSEPPPPSKMKKFENPTQNKDTDFKLWISSHGLSLFHSWKNHPPRPQGWL